MVDALNFIPKNRKGFVLMDTLSAIKSLVRTINICDVLDILVVAFLIYHLIKIIRESRAGQLVKGIVIILCGYFLAQKLSFRMLSAVLNNFFQFSVYGLLIVFQPELRRVLEQIGRSKLFGFWPLGSITRDEEYYIKECKNLASVVTEAAATLSSQKTGALIVFERQTKLGEIIDTGTILKAAPSPALICNIFFNKAPLHDGALIIKDGLLYAGGCILPLTKNTDISMHFGTRHRAAIGISENSDAVAVVVSEETGKISLAINGILKVYGSIETFKFELEEILIDRSKPIRYQNVFSSIRRGR